MSLWPRPQGPESEVEIVKGSQVLVTVDPKFQTRGTANTVWVDYPNIVRVLAVGSRIYIDDGLISLVVRKIGAQVPPNTGHLLFSLVYSRLLIPSPGWACFPTCPSSPLLSARFGTGHFMSYLGVGGGGEELRSPWFLEAPSLALPLLCLERRVSLDADSFYTRRSRGAGDRSGARWCPG